MVSFFLSLNLYFLLLVSVVAVSFVAVDEQKSQADDESKPTTTATNVFEKKVIKVQN